MMNLYILKSPYIILIFLSIIISSCIKVDSEVQSKIFFERREKLTPAEIRIVEDHWEKTGKWDAPTIIKPAEICVMDPKGKNLRVIFKKENNLPLYPDVSKDGEKIVFQDSENNILEAIEIYMIDTESKNLIKLIGGKQNGEPSWSPDGKKIAFSSNRDSKNYEIYVMNNDGTNLIKLTSNSGDDYSPSWSPDGKKIVFESNQDGKDYEIYVMNIEGTNLVRLTNNSVDDTDPVYSSDGKKIAFAHRYMLYIMDADGKNQVQLTDETIGVHSSSWSPDGKKIVFSGLIYEVNSTDIFVVDVKTKKLTNLTNTPDIDETNPSWRLIVKK